MDSLTQSQLESIKKLGTARVISKLLNVGYSEEELEPLDRNAFLELWGKCVAAGEDQPVAGPVARRNMGYDVELELQELQFEMRKFEAQQLAQQKANELKLREIESQRLAEEKANEQKRRKIEAQHELKLREIEFQERLKQAKLRLEEEKWSTERAEKETVVMLAKRYGDAMRAFVTPTGPSVIDVVFSSDTLRQCLIDLKFLLFYRLLCYKHILMISFVLP